MGIVGRKKWNRKKGVLEEEELKLEGNRELQRKKEEKGF